MARVLGYGGIANTNGARDFSGKEEAAPAEIGFTTALLLTNIGRCWWIIPFGVAALVGG